MIDTIWPPARCDELRKLWMQDAPQLSTREIGERMGASKNGVVGKAHRLKLPPRPSPIRRRAVLLPARATQKELRAIIALPAASPELPATLAAPAVEPIAAEPVVIRPPRPIRVRHCEWPMWGHQERPTHIYCDKIVESGRYCPECNRLAFPRLAAKAA